MTEYRRVLFLDSDLMPMGNLDYLFELSDGGKVSKSEDNDSVIHLKPNVILPGNNVAMCAGFFMVAPQPGDYARAKEIIHLKFLDAYKRGIVRDNYMGWGRPITEPDYYERRRGNRGTNWTWYGADTVRQNKKKYARPVKKYVGHTFFAQLVLICVCLLSPINRTKGLGITGPSMKRRMSLLYSCRK
jgi:hypothetical protein